jgi:hypothetical protein
MRKSIALVFLFLVGCGSDTKPDTDAAREFLQRQFSNPAIILDITLVEEPEYAAIPKISRGRSAKLGDKPAACGVRVRFTWRDEGRTTHEDWIVWVDSDHKAIDWCGNPERDNWRKYVQSLAKK